jgi:hypothetical protein
VDNRDRSENLRSCTYMEIQVIVVAHAPTKSTGVISSGVMLPCRRIIMGHFEW